MENTLEKKVTIKANGVEVTLEGYSTQEVSRILAGQQEPIREINLNELLNKQKLTIQEDFRHLVDTEEQKRMFSEKPLYVGDPLKPVIKITSIL